MFFDVLGTPPAELLLLAPVAGSGRGVLVPFGWERRTPYRTEALPPPEPSPKEPEPQRWLDDPRSDPIGWG